MKGRTEGHDGQGKLGSRVPPSVGIASRDRSGCWVCGSTELKVVKHSDLKGSLSPNHFLITDKAYGVTLELKRCTDCGFLQSDESDDVLRQYCELEDPQYESTRIQRSLQQRKLLEIIRRRKPRGRLLDIGAATGILVEEALAMGYTAEGVEPSAWLQEQAEQRGLPVHRGAFPAFRTNGLYDVVTLVDVLEHVPNPLSLLRSIRNILSADGVLLVVTPDVGSVTARMMGWRWWHFRFAHIGYFNRRTLRMLVSRAGMRSIAEGRPGWYFSAEYLLERISSYCPGPVSLPNTHLLSKITVPLNLMDSIYVLCTPSDV
jgi:2-polyprenyl-3-methyl-5-hydroxy-6-metoxy-1,4-benzoquinol methylase